MLRLSSAFAAAFALVDQPEQDVLGADVIVVEHPRLFLGEDDDPAGPIREPLEHVTPSGPEPCLLNGPGDPRTPSYPEAGRALRSGMVQCAFRSAPRKGIPPTSERPGRRLPNRFDPSRSPLSFRPTRFFPEYSVERALGMGGCTWRRPSDGELARMGHASSAIRGVVGAPTVGQDSCVRKGLLRGVLPEGDDDVAGLDRR